MSLAIFLAALCALIALGTPIAFTLFLTGTLMLYQLGTFDTAAVAQYMLEGGNNYQLLAVPFFMLAGELMNEGGISRRIVALAVALMAHIKGGLGYVVIAVAIVLASLSGSAVADAAALAGVLLPMMRNNGYDEKQSAGLIAAGAIIGPVIPPSIAFIVFGVATNLSITRLFFAGIFPGLIIGLALALTWWWKMRSAVVNVSDRQPSSVCVRRFYEAFWGLLLPVIIIVGLRGGIFTATEAAVVAAVYALVISVFVYRELKISQLRRVFVASAKTTSIIMFLIAASFVSSYAITLADLPGEVTSIVEPLLDSPIIFMAVAMILLLSVGCVLDVTPTILILAPVLLPVAVKAGIDPIYFGVMFVINGSIGLITPPVGTVLNVVAGVGKLRLDDVVSGAWLYMVVLSAVVMLFVVYPGLITEPAKWLYR
ncbi:MAG: TRAP transporter large permease subunit [Propionivibrio sp.]